MDTKKFNLWNRLTALLVLAVSLVTYLSTMEPTASFWDCGEFIASSYKLEVGHPPGNPVFQLVARFFTIFGDKMHAALLVNAVSAICSALTVFLLYLTIVFFVKRLVRPGADGRYSLADAVAIFGSGAVGALAFSFTDTFWFSAVESEVYGMSSLFTALVFWAMIRWYETADEPYANRWIVLISFLMGLSIGVHLLNLLCIPALVFMFYYRKRENGDFSFWEFVKILAISGVIIGVILFLIIPWLPKMAAYADLAFVNGLGLPYNSGAAFFMVALLALCFWGLFRTLKREKVLWNTVLLCLTTIIIGFSIFSIVIIRSCAKTPTNEYQPDNAFTLVRYLSREQYGSKPILYGEYFDAPYEVTVKRYWAPLDGKYVHVEGPVDVKYKPEGKMLFPRMWSPSNDGSKEEFYEEYMNGKGKRIEGADHRKPTMGANLAYFFDYQLNWMYWRYFMWNFVGRQNDIHSPTPGNIFLGNWESGIKFIDDFRLGDQSDAPGFLKDNKGKNHYYFLPLLLGLLGLFFQFGRDKRGCWLVFLLFFMTGIAIIIYLNQPPYEVRERDYSYAGSFYAFSIWIGLAVAAVYGWLRDALHRDSAPAAFGVALLLLFVPALMAAQNWDDHDRSNRRTAVEIGYNYLNSVGENGILVTHGDNDTFPLWYAQEVEGVRPDVRICNTSLLGTDWHIDQMKYAMNESAPLDLSLGLEKYLYGTNEIVYIYDTRDQVIPLADVMAVFRHPDAKIALASGKRVDYIVSRRFSIPVDKENVLRHGIVSEKFADLIPEEIVLEIPEGKEYLTKPELFMLDLLSNYKWDRPLSLLNYGGDLNIGIKDYLMYEGFSYRFVPIRNTPTTRDAGLVDTDRLYRNLTEVFTFDAVSRDDWYVDYQNLYTYLGAVPLRVMFVTAADAFLKAGETDRALEMLDMCQEKVPATNFPIETIPIGFSGNVYMMVEMVDQYYRLGQRDKARDLGIALANELITTARFYLEFYEYAVDEFELCGNYVYYLADTFKVNGDEGLSGRLVDNFSRLVDLMTGKEDGDIRDTDAEEMKILN